MTLTDDRPTIGEHYAVAVNSGNLTPHLARRTDADVLLSAGIAASRDPRRMLALSAYRLAVSGDTQGLHALVEQMDAWLQAWLARGGNRPMRYEARRELMLDTLGWWIKQVCGYCGGSGRSSIEGGAPGAVCEGCHGTGKRPLAREVPHAHIKHAERLVDELDRLVLVIHADMSRLLSQKMDLDL